MRDKMFLEKIGVSLPC